MVNRLLASLILTVLAVQGCVTPVAPQKVSRDEFGCNVPPPAVLTKINVSVEVATIAFSYITGASAELQPPEVVRIYTQEATDKILRDYLRCRERGGKSLTPEQQAWWATFDATVPKLDGPGLVKYVKEQPFPGASAPRVESKCPVPASAKAVLDARAPETAEISQGEYIFSESGRYRFGISKAGDVALCEVSEKDQCLCDRILWQSDTAAVINERLRGDQSLLKLVLQKNGQLGIYAWVSQGRSVVICGSDTAGPDGSYSFQVTNAGTAEVWGPKGKIWTSSQGRFACATQAEVDLALAR